METIFLLNLYAFMLLSGWVLTGKTAFLPDSWLEFLRLKGGWPPAEDNEDYYLTNEILDFDAKAEDGTVIQAGLRIPKDLKVPRKQDLDIQPTFGSRFELNRLGKALSCWVCAAFYPGLVFGIIAVIVQWVSVLDAISGLLLATGMLLLSVRLTGED